MIMRDVNNGWLIRYTHANVASFFFIFVYALVYNFINSDILFYSNKNFINPPPSPAPLPATQGGGARAGRKLTFSCYFLFKKDISDALLNLFNPSSATVLRHQSAGVAGLEYKNIDNVPSTLLRRHSANSFHTDTLKSQDIYAIVKCNIFNHASNLHINQNSTLPYIPSTLTRRALGPKLMQATTP